MADLIQIRRDTAANWTSANPILAQGELGAETDTDKIKIGDGTTAWSSLDYLIDTGGYVAYSDTTANFTGTLQNGGSNVLVDADIGVSVQAYDATTLKSADIGVSVQAYDANLSSFVAAFTLPTVDGSSDQVLKTDGAGNISFATPSAGVTTGKAIAMAIVFGV